MKKKILLGLALILIIGQFIRPKQNVGNGQDQLASLQEVVDVDPATASILIKACTDCHSNHTQYPWYNSIFPVSWYLYNHVYGGKKHLDFSVFATMPVKKQIHKLEEVIEMVDEGEMPLKSYTWLHPEAAMTPEEANQLKEWAKGAMAGLK